MNLQGLYVHDVVKFGQHLVLGFKGGKAALDSENALAGGDESAEAPALVEAGAVVWM